MKGLAKAWRDIITGPDGETVAIGRVFSLPTLFAGLALPFWAVFKGQSIDWAGLGVYVGGLAGGVTALIKLTNSTEPPPPASGQ